MSDNKKNWHEIKEAFDADEEIEMSESASTSTEVHEEALPNLSHEDLLEQLQLAEKTAHENWEKAARAMAELENVRKRAEKDIADAHAFGVKKLLESMIPVVDSLEQALLLIDENTQPAMNEGLVLTMKMFIDVLQKQGVEQINPEGATFDPNRHEAMSMQVVDNVAPNTVLAVYQKGYALNGRMVRPARVVVAKSN